MKPYLIQDTVLERLCEQIADHAPERGGALLGPRGQWHASRFIFDPEATTTAASYVPSAQLTREINRIEAGGSEELKMIVHSHPGRFDRLSGPDLSALATTLRENPHLSFIGAPIVTRDHPVEGNEPHVLSLGRTARITFYAASRLPGRPGGLPRITPLPVRVIPAAASVRKLALALGTAPRQTERPQLQRVDFQGVSLLVSVLTHSDGETILLFSDDYPVVPPLVLHTATGGDTTPLPIRWSPKTFGGENQLAGALLEALHNRSTRSRLAAPSTPSKSVRFRRLLLPAPREKRKIRFLFPENPAQRSF